jgi:16S rRNA (cytosine1402-N4)-methyltransferase
MMHQPVMLNEVIEYLNIKSKGIYVDGTFGRGGHAMAILQKLSAEGRLLAIDKDPAAVAAAQELTDERLQVKQGSFTQLQTWIEQLNLVHKIDGILLDLGVSSPQLEDAARGFSFLKDGPLDMRMDTAHGIDAATWINNARSEEIAEVLKEYGEERFSYRIANAIVRERKAARITTTKRLAEIVTQANPKWERHKHPATRSFQAIRIYINNELNDLPIALKQSLEVLAVGGRLAVISFHSLEDRIVKRFMREHNRKSLRIVGKIIRPTAEEIVKNVRARSAILRVGEKIA